MYALKALSRLLESDQSLVLETGPNNLSFTYIRMGLLHEKSGNKTEASIFFAKAIDSYTGDNFQLSQLKEAVAKLDGHSI